MIWKIILLVVGFIVLFALMYWLADGVDKEDDEFSKYQEYLVSLGSFQR
jgi:hypothetical protein